MSEIRVIGTPRSGTNLIKYLVESSTDCVCRFNVGWWKHSIIPPLMTLGGTTVPDDLPTVIMFREPSRQVVSFYNFAAKGRTAISGASSFETFIASPIVMTTPGEANRYTFRTPIDYWSQFYYAALEWRHPNKIFIELSDLQAEPDLTLAAMREIFPDRSFASMASLPEQYLGRNGDAPISEAWGYETDTTLQREAEAAEALLASATGDQCSHLAPPFALELYDRLQARKLRG
jgi:hypothetical protein